MPQASEEQREKWMHGTFIGIEKAEGYLEQQGYIRTKGYCWIRPDKTKEPTEEELSAINFLIDEWDYGGWVDSEEEGKSLFKEQTVESKDSDFSSPWG